MSDESIGDVIARNYSAGRAIGNDFSRARFERHATRIQDEFTQRAKDEGKPVESYKDEIESRLHEAAIKTGAVRRGLRGTGGGAIETDFTDRIKGKATEQSNIRAGALDLAGNHAGARTEQAKTSYAYGDVEAGRQSQLAADQIGATTAAIQPDGMYNESKGAFGTAGVAAKYGDINAANTQTDAGHSFRFKAAAAKAGVFMNIVQNPDQFSPDQVAGVWHSIQEQLPEYAHIDVRKTGDHELTYWANGQPAGHWDLTKENDKNEVLGMLNQFTRDPTQTVATGMQARIKAIEESKAQRNKVNDQFSAAVLDVVKNAKVNNVDPGVISKVMELVKPSPETNGFQLQEITGDGHFMVAKGGQVYSANLVSKDPVTGTPLDTPRIELTDGQGKPVPMSALDRAKTDDTLGKALMSIALDVSRTNNATGIEWMNGQLGIINKIWQQQLDGVEGSTPAGTQGTPLPQGGSAGSHSRAARNNNPGNIEDHGQFKGMPGYLGSDGRFAKFASPEAGQAAMAHQLERYMDGKTTGKKLLSINQIISTWSPQKDPTNAAGVTANYINFVAQKLGIDPRAPLSKAQIPELASVMSQFESGDTGSGGSAPAAATAVADTPLPPPLDYVNGGQRGAIPPRAADGLPPRLDYVNGGALASNAPPAGAPAPGVQDFLRGMK